MGERRKKEEKEKEASFYACFFDHPLQELSLKLRSIFPMPAVILLFQLKRAGEGPEAWTMHGRTGDEVTKTGIVMSSVQR